MSLFDQCMARSETVGTFQTHPFGRFSATFTKVEVKTYDGRRLFELHLKSHAGTAKHTVWVNTEADIQGSMLKAAGGDHELAKQRYIDHMGRVIRLYKITDLTPPTDERACYARLGELKGRSVTMEVKKNPKDERNPYINLSHTNDLHRDVNAEAAGNPNDWAAEPAPTGAVTVGPLEAGQQPDLSDVPF